MDDSSSLSPAQGGFWKHSNITLTAARHGGKTVAYRIFHLRSGKVYVGWLGDAYRGLTLIAARLQAGNFPNHELQYLMTDSPECRLEVFMPDARLPIVEFHDLLRSVMDEWIVDAGAAYIHSSVALPPKKPVPGEIRRVRGERIKPAPVPKAPKPPKEPKPPKVKAERKGRAPTGPWKNIPMSLKLHSVCGAFKLFHWQSGQSFVASSKNVYDILSNTRHRLANQLHNNEKLQAAYNAQPEFELTLYLTDKEGLDINGQLDLADQQVNLWQTELAEACVVIGRGRTRGTNGRVSGVVASEPRPRGRSSGSGEMHQITVKAQDGRAQAPGDFLHQAWFSYQRVSA